MAKFTLHPFLFAIFPIIFTYAENTNYFPLNVVFLPIAFMLVTILLVHFILNKASRNSHEAGVLTSAPIFAFFSFGHFVTILNEFHIDFQIGERFITTEKVLFAIWIALFALFIFFVVRYKINYSKITKLLNFVAIVLLTFSAYNIITYNVAGSITIENDYLGAKKDSSFATTPNKPDIYYMILDGYGRNDVFREYYDFDNSSFTKKLEERGFYVASQSAANYCQTALSLSSTLNMRYLDDIIQEMGSETNNMFPLKKLIQNNVVTRSLKDNGYEIVNFSSGFPPTDDLNNADYKFSYLSSSLAMGEFEMLIISTTYIYPIIRKYFGGYSQRRERIRFSFEKLKEVPLIESPTFTFAHFISPHPPFLFKSDGSDVEPLKDMGTHDANNLVYKNGITSAQYIDGYIEQVKFLNDKFIETLDAIVSNSKGPPLVILQGDHGPAAYFNYHDPVGNNYKERFAIINAFLLPDKSDSIIFYKSMSPVNTYRVLLNQYFDGNYEILEDASYFSTPEFPYDIKRVKVND